MSSPSSELWTLQDTIDHLVDVYDFNEGDRNYRAAVRAVSAAYRDMPNHGDWSYLTRRGLINTVASQSTGTVEYDHTGGSYENQLTLTGATWPSWAEYGQVLIDGVRYPISERVSDTIVTLDSQVNPGKDLAALTAYTVARSTYDLPAGAISVGGTLVEISTGYEVGLVSPEQLLDVLRGNYSPSRPLVATIRASGQRPNTMELEFAPPPSSVREFEFVYQYRPGKFSVVELSTGTASISAGGTTLTHSGTGFTADMLGAVVRLASDGVTGPTPLSGRLVSGSHVSNPPAFETTVRSFTSASQLELMDAADATYSNVKFTISDRIDLEPGAMLQYFLRLCELEFARSTRNVDARETDRLESVAHRALISALAADSRNHYPNRTGSDVRFYSLSDWDDSGG